MSEQDRDDTTPIPAVPSDEPAGGDDPLDWLVSGATARAVPPGQADPSGDDEGSYSGRRVYSLDDDAVEGSDAGTPQAHAADADPSGADPSGAGASAAGASDAGHDESESGGEVRATYTPLPTDAVLPPPPQEPARSRYDEELAAMAPPETPSSSVDGPTAADRAAPASQSGVAAAETAPIPAVAAGRPEAVAPAVVAGAAGYTAGGQGVPAGYDPATYDPAAYDPMAAETPYVLPGVTVLPATPPRGGATPWWQWAVVGALGVLLLGGAVWWFLLRGGEEPAPPVPLPTVTGALPTVAPSDGGTPTASGPSGSVPATDSTAPTQSAAPSGTGASGTPSGSATGGGAVVTPGTVPTAPPRGSQAQPLSEVAVEAVLGPTSVAPRPATYFVKVGGTAVLRYAASGSFTTQTLVQKGPDVDVSQPIGTGAQSLTPIGKPGTYTWTVKETGQSIMTVVGVP